LATGVGMSVADAGTEALDLLMCSTPATGSAAVERMDGGKGTVDPGGEEVMDVGRASLLIGLDEPEPAKGGISSFGPLPTSPAPTGSPAKDNKRSAQQQNYILQ
jgi:hypothetical protein